LVAGRYGYKPLFDPALEHFFFLPGKSVDFSFWDKVFLNRIFLLIALTHYDCPRAGQVAGSREIDGTNSETIPELFEVEGFLVSYIFRHQPSRSSVLLDVEVL